MRPIIPIIIAFSLTSCSRHYDHVAETNISGALIRIGLMHSHPFLAEYKKYLEVEHAGRKTRKELFPDSGAFSWVALVDDRGTIELRDFGGVQWSSWSGLAKDKRVYLGRFDFDQNKIYRFIPASEDPQEPPMIEFKG